LLDVDVVWGENPEFFLLFCHVALLRRDTGGPT
jgi:hypothetical protein